MEQVALVHRLLGEIRTVAQEEGIDLSSATKLVTRKISEMRRKHLSHLSKKFVLGMSSISGGSLSYRTFMDPWSNGEFDNVVNCTTNPAISGKYWHWVKAALAEAKEPEARAEEVQFMIKKNLWKVVPVSECWAKSGKPLVRGVRTATALGLRQR